MRGYNVQHPSESLLRELESIESQFATHLNAVRRVADVLQPEESQTAAYQRRQRSFQPSPPPSPQLQQQMATPSPRTSPIAEATLFQTPTATLGPAAADTIDSAERRALSDDVAATRSEVEMLLRSVKEAEAAFKQATEDGMAATAVVPAHAAAAAPSSAAPSLAAAAALPVPVTPPPLVAKLERGPPPPPGIAGAGGHTHAARYRPPPPPPPPPPALRRSPLVQLRAPGRPLAPAPAAAPALLNNHETPLHDETRVFDLMKQRAPNQGALLPPPPAPGLAPPAPTDGIDELLAAPRVGIVQHTFAPSETQRKGHAIDVEPGDRVYRSVDAPARVGIAPLGWAWITLIESGHAGFVPASFVDDSEGALAKHSVSTVPSLNTQRILDELKRWQDANAIQMRTLVGLSVEGGEYDAPR